MKVLIILGHPRKDSFCGALATSYAAGAKEAGAEIKTLALADLDFNLNVTLTEPQHQHAEDDIVEAKQLISWADHLVFV